MPLYPLPRYSGSYKWHDKFDRFVLLGDRGTACLLQPGTHRILPNPALEGPTCGLC